MKKSLIILILLGILLISAIGISQIDLKSESERSEYTIESPNYGKPGAAVTLNYSVPKQLQTNQSIVIPIELLSSSTRLKLGLGSSDSVKIVSNHATELELEQGIALVEVALLTPAQSGLYYLYLNVQEIGDNGQNLLSRSLAIPLYVGIDNNSKLAPALKTNGKVVEQNGEKIIEMIADPN